MYCWIEGRAVLPHPTAPPARDGSIDELEDLELCVLGGSQSAISGTMVLSYHGKDYRQPAEVYPPSVHPQDGLEIRQCCCCHCAVAGCGDVLMCWRLSRCCQCAVADAAMCS